MLSDSMCSTADTPLDNHPRKVEKVSASGVREWLNANEEMHITTTLKSENCCVSPWAQFLERLSQISSKVFSSKNMQLEVTKYC